MTGSWLCCSRHARTAAGWGFGKIGEAGGTVPALPWLMDHSDSSDLLHDLIMAAHRDLGEVEAIIGDHPELLDRPHPDSGETPLGAAAHMGRRATAARARRQTRRG